jgi:hypothetical protein
MGMIRFRIRNVKIVLVGKYRYSKKEKEDLISKSTTWNKWSLGFWFRKNRIVGVKNIKDPSKWKSGLVNDYMLGIELLIFQGWINWNVNGAIFDMESKRKEMKEKKQEYTYEITATDVIRTGKAYKGMPESDMIIEIYKSTLEREGKKKTRYLMNVDEDYISDCISEINEMLKSKV